MTMRGLTIAGILVGALLIALAPVADTLYRQAYPADRVRAQALISCARENPDFDRLNAAARAACYRRSFTRPHADPAPARHRIEAGAAVLPG